MTMVYVVEAHWNCWGDGMKSSNGTAVAFSDLDTAKQWCKDHVYTQGGYNRFENDVYYSDVHEAKTHAQASIRSYELDPEPELPGFEEWKKPPVFKDYCGGRP